jgi:hypothetical protein
MKLMEVLILVAAIGIVGALVYSSQNQEPSIVIASANENGVYYQVIEIDSYKCVRAKTADDGVSIWCDRSK